jgi:hypothetical protein
MSENTEIMIPSDAEMLEKVLVGGDLSKLTASQRLDYYRQVCQTMNLNPLSRPFEYITLKGKLMLYAKKDATDQLRKIHAVSIDDIKITDDEDGITVIVKGHDKDGRSDVEIGCVSKDDKTWNVQNLKMKAVTKAKRRLTLSLCGLGWLDETEIETIPDAKPVVVDTTGVIVEQPRIDSKAVSAVTTINNASNGEKPSETSQKREFDEIEFLRQWQKPGYVLGMAREKAETMLDSKGKPYGEKSTKDLFFMLRTISKQIETASDEQKENYAMKVSAICEILQNRKLEKTLADPDDNPFVKKGAAS